MLDVAFASLGHSLEWRVRSDRVLNRLKALPRRPAVHREVALVTRVAFEWSRRRYVVVLNDPPLSLHLPLRVVGWKKNDKFQHLTICNTHAAIG